MFEGCKKVHVAGAESPSKGESRGDKVGLREDLSFYPENMQPMKDYNLWSELTA